MFAARHANKIPEIDRFWAKVKITNDCWIWTGARSPLGYGRFTPNSKPSSSLAHRYAYEIMIGPIPTGLLVCHHCDTPACVNPSHLFVGTDADNLRDMRQKNRHSYGQSHGISKLDDKSVRLIRKLYTEDKLTQPEIAKQFGVTFSTINQIIRRKTWKHVQ